MSISAAVFRELLVGLNSDAGLRVSADGDEVGDALFRVDQALSEDQQNCLHRSQTNLGQPTQAYNIIIRYLDTFLKLGNPCIVFTYITSKNLHVCISMYIPTSKNSTL